MTGTLLGSTAFAQDDAKETDAGSQHSTEERPPADQPTPVLQAVPQPAPDATAAAPASRPKVGDISTSGYFRGSFGASNQKGRMTCFKLALPGGLFSKYRLGNECEVWGEYNITTVVHVGDDGSVARLHFMPTVFIPTSTIGYSPNGAVNTPNMYSTATGAVLYFPNLYVDLKGISWLGGGTAWLGTRYYKRESVYISDFFYWNPSGVGSGVEDIELGRDMRLSVAVFAVDGDPGATTAGYPPLPLQLDFGARADVQLRGVKLWTGGELQLGFQYILDLSHDHVVGGENVHVTASGWGATLQYIQKLPRAVENKLAVQYGRGGGTGFGTLARFYYPDFSVTHGPSEFRYRVVDVLNLEPMRWLGAQLAFVYQRDDLKNAGQNSRWWSAGGRVGVGVLEHVKLLGEIGYDRVKKDNGADPQELKKATAAVALTGGQGFMTRPELRAFATYALWNEAARTATIDSGPIYTSTDYLSGWIFGLQAEAWW
ncbi:MAG TPA: carbohydrate porin [Polyangia bacterium]